MAKFEPGHKLSTGRPKGSANQLTREVQRLIQERGFNAIEAYLEIFDEAIKQYKKADSFDPHASIAALSLAFNVTKEIAAHSLPKVKAVEVKDINPMDEMSPEEKLEIVKEYALALEAQVQRE